MREETQTEFISFKGLLRFYTCVSIRSLTYEDRKTIILLSIIFPFAPNLMQHYTLHIHKIIQIPPVRGIIIWHYRTELV